MPTVLQDLNTSVPTIDALRNSITTFTLIASGIRTEINEFLSDTYGVGKTLTSWTNEIYNATTGGWVADRARFLNATVTFPIYYSLTTAVTGYVSVVPPVSSFGIRQKFYGNLSEWSISQSVSSNPSANRNLLPVSAFETIDRYANGPMILSATRTSPTTQTYTKDQYDFYLNDQTFRFVCRYLNETPVDVARGEHCRGLIYSLSAMEMGTTSMTNQISFETTKRAQLSRLL